MWIREIPAVVVQAEAEVAAVGRPLEVADGAADVVGDEGLGAVRHLDHRQPAEIVGEGDAVAVGRPGEVEEPRRVTVGELPRGLAAVLVESQISSSPAASEM